MQKQRYRVIEDPTTGVWLQGYGLDEWHPTGYEKLTHANVGAVIDGAAKARRDGVTTLLCDEPLALPGTHCPNCQKPGLSVWITSGPSETFFCGRCFSYGSREPAPA